MRRDSPALPVRGCETAGAGLAGAFLLASLHGSPSSTRPGTAPLLAEATAARTGGTALFPLARPFSVGPGSIPVAVALGLERPRAGEIALFRSGAASPRSPRRSG